ncbi:hypothetical protein [Spirosoma radiotolerans]|uniref:Outer membrane protein beta-barrel domain-containing protein n=1 Tax=Spirosoma radiotolerans TaxID=1379870 RepID=A0A0E3ZXP4_9BACT|nr:hypothetical protein [Spirosoma radiotolerans]AKD56513.1 hypothetical protein SD10_17995 [Spirosoma radiotolerans]
MMKRYFLYVLLGFAVLPTYGQGITDYYRLPEQSQHYDRLLTRYGGPYIKSRWYASLDGFIRTDRAKLDNSFDGLIQSDVVGKAGWGAVVGWVYRERWAFEAGYARMPIHTQVSVTNASYPLVFRYNSKQNAFVLRGKRLVVSTSKPWLRSGFWLSGGMWIVPNSGQQEGKFSLIGYRYDGRRETPDTLRLASQTQANTRMTALAELGAEYNIRLSNAIDLGFSVRKFWGLSNALTTDVTYAVNYPATQSGEPNAGSRTSVQKAQLLGDGSGMSYGVTLRYTFATRRQLTNALDVRGKTPHIR